MKFANKADKVDITILDYPDCVRLRKEMYLSDKTHAIFEIVDNAVDEHLAGYCDTITVIVNHDESIKTIDNGRGISVDRHKDPRYSHLTEAEVAYTVLHAGGKFGGASHSYKSATSGLHGVGASVVNATSSKLTMNVFKEGNVYEACFSKGVITSPMKKIGTCDLELSGTQVQFLLDETIWLEETFDYKKLYRKLNQLAYLNPGLHIIYQNEITDESYQFYFENGIKSYVDMLVTSKKPIMDTLYQANTVQEVAMQFALAYSEDFSANTHSFCNNVATESGGDHLIGMHHGIAKAINDFALERKYIKEDERFDISDCLEGATAIIAITVKEVKFDGQGKSRIRMPYIKNIVKNNVFNICYHYLDAHPEEASKIIEKAFLAQKARFSAQKARENVRKQKQLGIGNAKGLAPCSEKDPELCEIYIVEGDSAGGTAKTARDKKTQAILPIFGKILNTGKNEIDIDKILDNDKLENLVKSLKCGIGDDFDISQVRYHRIVITSDADVDGAHIQTLYLAFFYRYYKPLIEAGYIYVSVPPLYKISVSKNKKEEIFYAYTDSEKDDYVIMYPLATVQRYKGLGEMMPEQLWDTVLNPETRTQIQITLEDAENAEEMMEVCMGKNVARRKTFIENNAIYAELVI